MNNNCAIEGDCCQVLKNFPDNTFDLIFADPPYYLQLPNNKRLKRFDGSEIIPVYDERWNMNNCPNEEELACYFDGLLPEGEVKQLEKHLFECDRCREIVEVTRKVIEETK